MMRTPSTTVSHSSTMSNNPVCQKKTLCASFSFIFLFHLFILLLPVSLYYSVCCCPFSSLYCCCCWCCSLYSLCFHLPLSLPLFHPPFFFPSAHVSSYFSLATAFTGVRNLSPVVLLARNIIIYKTRQEES